MIGGIVKQDASDETNRLLRAVVALLVRQRPHESLNLKEQIRILNDLGLKPGEIARIIGRSNVHVSKELSNLKRMGR